MPASLYQQNMRKATTGPLSTEAAKPLQHDGILGAESGLFTYGNWPIVVAPRVAPPHISRCESRHKLPSEDSLLGGLFFSNLLQ